MRVAFLGPRESIHTIRWANEMVDRGHDVHLISIEPHGDPLYPRVRFHQLPHSAPIGYFTNVWAVRRILNEVEPDVLSVHFASGYGTLARLVGFQPSVLSVWGSDIYDFPNRSMLHKLIVRRNLSFASTVCSTSHAMADQIRHVHQGIAEIHITPFGVDTEKFAPSLREERREIVIGTVKTLSHKYGIDCLLEAFALVLKQLQDTKPSVAECLVLQIVGGGPLGDQLQELAEKLSLGNKVVFVGPVPHSQVPQYLNNFDVYVAASRSESFGVAILEASSCGLPVVVSRVGGLPEVVVENVTGLIVEKEDVGHLASALLRVILDYPLRREMGQEGRKHVLRNFNWLDNASALERVFVSHFANDDARTKV